MRTVYLIRHGQADTGSGRKHVCLGRMDVPLSREGERQVQGLARFFKGKRLDGIFSSPLTRCLDTVRIAAEASGHADIPVSVVDDFTEVDTGEWDGMDFSEIREKYPAAYEERGRHLGTFVIPGGESLAAAGERFAAAFIKMLTESEGDLLVAAHAGVIRAFLCMLTGTKIDLIGTFRIPCTSVTVLKVREQEEEKRREGSKIRQAEDLRKCIEIAAAGFRPAEEMMLSEVDRIWTECAVTEQQRRHMEAVADMAMNLIGYDISLVRADRMETAWPCGNGFLNVRAVYYAALLHDIRRSEGGRFHAEAGSAYLEREGYHEVASIVKMHHNPEVYRTGEPLSEAEVVYYADKLVQEDRMVSLEERFAQSRQRCASEEALKNHERRYRAACGIRDKLALISF